MFRYLGALVACLSKLERVSIKPIYIQLEPTTDCNLQCRMCPRANLIRKPRNMKLDEFKQIIDAIQPKKLSLSGFGEPFANPELMDMISYAKQKDISVSTCTNCTLIESTSAKAIQQSGLDLLKISIDSAIPETYRFIRGEDYFGKVINVVENILDSRKETNSRKPYIRFQCIPQRSNIGELSKILELAAYLGVDAVFFQPLEMENIGHLRRDLEVQYPEIASALRKAQVTAEQIGIDTNLDMLISKPIEYWYKYPKEDLRERRYRWNHQMCLFPWFSTYVSVEGDLRPCCLFVVGKEANMGNVFRDGFDSVWNGEKYRDLRKAMGYGSSPFKRCETCVPPTYSDILKLRKVLPGFLH